MRLAAERAEIIEYCLRMQRDELTVGTSGNLSIRSGDLIAITPSGAPYEDLTPASISVITPDGEWVDGELEPSSEVPMHTSVYANTDARAVVHTHPLYASTLSTVLTELPPIHYMVALLGGPVRVAPYATYGSQELAENSVTAMRDRFGALLRNHGATTYGENIAKAYTRSVYLEWCCRMYHQAKLVGEPTILGEDEIELVAKKLGSYGQTVK